MKNFWIVAFCVAVCGAYVQAQAEDEYDNYFNYDDLDDIDKMIDEINENVDKKTDIDNDLKVEEEIQQFREADREKPDSVDDPKDTVDNLDDYQFEDNRDKSKDEEEKVSLDSKDIEEVIENDLDNRPEPDDPNAPSRNEDYALLWGDDNVAPLPVPETVEEDDNEAILEETKQILEEQDADNFEDEIRKEIEKTDFKPDKQSDLEQGDDDDENKAILEETKQILEEQDTDTFEEAIRKEIEKTDFKSDEQPDLEKILEETKQILAGIGDSLNNDESNVEEDIKKQILEETKQLLAESNDSFSNDDSKVENPVDQILDETKKLLAENDDSFSNGETKVDEEAVEMTGEDNTENKNEGDEDTVDKVYADLNADLDKLFETLDKLANDSADKNDNDEDIDKALELADKYFEELDNREEASSKELEEDNKYEDVDLDKLLEEILSEDDMKAEDSAAEILEPLLNDALNEPNPDDAIEKDVETVDSKANPVLYLNDAILDEPKENAETLENSAENKELTDAKDASIEKPVKTALVDDLNSSELEDLVRQFSILHSEDIDVHEEDFDKNVPPVHIALKLDEPTIITSSEYPDPYPTNNIVDWILEGPGEGIELNITSFAVNGALGDYLLIKPGGLDDESHEKLIFTYRLSSERRFRFTDVDKLFIRFESKPGPEDYNGFSLSAKLIAPLPSEPEPIPEPEAVVTPPHSTATVTLALPLPEFRKVEGDFLQVLADMAQQYIEDYEVDPGLNTTSEVTQITGVDVCPMTWPGYEGCTAVTFGVPLVYEDEDADPKLDQDDLKTMWTTYINRDPFALRLRVLGISEFYAPNSAMTAWLVIAGGVVISMAMLAFVLWRYSFEGYTRMKADSDTDSLHNEKRNLDLYPTPHQTLPPLYANMQNDYKWADDDTRVDMGGFANRSYTRENMYDFDSDEDVVVTTRDRQGAVTTKDYSSNV